MNGKIQRAVEIGILLIALAFIATPVAAANLNQAYNMNTFKIHEFKYFLPADMSTEYRSPLLHYTPSMDLSPFNPAIPVSNIEDSSLSPFVQLPTIRWKVCG
ncbi:MAG: hypothetical protein WCK53_06700 [Methanomicrobiales archaeon]